MLRSTRGARPFLESRRNLRANSPEVSLLTANAVQPTNLITASSKKPDGKGVFKMPMLMLLDRILHTVISVVSSHMAGVSYP
jgi:hypothetical protein